VRQPAGLPATGGLAGLWRLLFLPQSLKGTTDTLSL